MSAELKNARHVVYWLRDRDGELLYVGMTHDLDARFAAHQKSKAWWGDVDPTTTSVVEYGNHDDAAEAEQRAIRQDLPKHNVSLGRHVNPPRPRQVLRSLRVPADLWDRAKAKADERGENISDVIREALERYVRRR